MTSHGICQSVGMSLRKGEHFLFWTKIVRTKIKPDISPTPSCRTCVHKWPLFTRSCWQVPHNNSSLKQQHPKPILVQDCAMCTSSDQASCCAAGKTSSQPLLNCSNNSGRTSFSTTPAAAAIGLTRRAGHGIGAGGSVKLHVGHRPVIKKRVTLR